MFKISGDFNGYCKIDGKFLLFRKSSILKNLFFHGLVVPISLGIVSNPGYGAGYVMLMLFVFPIYKGTSIRLFKTTNKILLREFISAKLIDIKETKDNRAVKGYLRSAAISNQLKGKYVGAGIVGGLANSIDDKEVINRKFLSLLHIDGSKFLIQTPDVYFFNQITSWMKVNLQDDVKIKMLVALAEDKRLEDEIKRKLDLVTEDLAHTQNEYEHGETFEIREKAKLSLEEIRREADELTGMMSFYREQ